MEKIASTTKQRKKQNKNRSQRGQGRLYKRDNSGKEHSADYKGGVFYLEYKANGKRIKQRLVNNAGEPITVRKDAELARARIMAPFAAKGTVDQLKAVQAKLADAETAYEQAVDEANPPLSISDAWDAYVQNLERPDSSPEMLNYYASYWRRFTEWLSGTNAGILFLRDVTAQTAQNYAVALGHANFSSNTFNKHTNFLRLLFKVLRDQARMQENPFERIRRKKLNSHGRRELTIAELKIILENASGDLQTLLFIGTFTGLRLGDCCTLKWGEVDLDRGLIRRITNKTAKKQKPVLIGIPSALSEKLHEIPASKRKGFVLPSYAGTYLHRNEKGSPTRRSQITNEIQQHFLKCGIKTTNDETQVKQRKRTAVEVGFHSLRHTYVSIHAEHGTPQAVVQAVVGHGSPAMTAHYTHIGEDTARQVANVLTLDVPSTTVQKEIPAWVKEKLMSMTKDSWEQIKLELLGE
ncbi:MAG: tyrosine-type recombinase/integrase [Kiritimatiellales bacterium]